MLDFQRSVYITVYLYSRETIKLVREGFKKIIFVYISQMGEGGLPPPMKIINFPPPKKGKNKLGFINHFKEWFCCEVCDYNSQEETWSTHNNFVSVVITCKSIIAIVFFYLTKTICLEQKKSFLVWRKCSYWGWRKLFQSYYCLWWRCSHSRSEYS